MKKAIIYSTALLLLGATTLTSCEDFLDKEPSNQLTGEQTFSEWKTMEQFHLDTYNFLRNGECRINNSWLDAATDLSECSMSSSGTRVSFNIGNYYASGAANELTDPWEHYYRGIRKCNMLLDTIETVPKAADESQETYELHKEWYKGEAKFFRAYFYWELFLRYGPIPVVKEVLDPDGDLLSGYTTRPTLKEYVVDFIIDELRQAENMVMDYESSHLSGNEGRINKDICCALLSRIYLYMASPRYAEESGITWQQAADETKRFIDTYGSHYRLYTDGGSYVANYTNAILLNAHTESNPEVIFYRSDVSQGWSSYGFNNDTPVGSGGNGGNCPSQNLVDMYDMADGNSPFLSYDATGAPVYINDRPQINTALNYDDTHPTENRDPRLTASILFHGQTWSGRMIDVREGMADNPTGNANATPTGYYMRKYMPEVILQNNHTGTSYRNWIIIRYAEILLNYAEALNEVNGPTEEVCDLLEQVRSRVGMNIDLYRDRPDLQHKDEMRNFIHKERTVELAFEEHRGWDLRRWNVATEALSRPIYGVDVDENGNYTRKIAQQRVFEDRMYLYPIPETEYWKTGIENNPEW